MKDQLDDIHQTYNVRPLQCYTKNLTPSNSPKFFTLVSESGKFVEALFKQALDNLSGPIEESATFDSSGLLSFKTNAFGNIPGYQLPTSLFQAFVCCCMLCMQETSEKWKEAIID